MSTAGNPDWPAEHYSRRLLLALQAMQQSDSDLRNWGLNQVQAALERVLDSGFGVTIGRTDEEELTVTVIEQRTRCTTTPT